MPKLHSDCPMSYATFHRYLPSSSAAISEKNSWGGVTSPPPPPPPPPGGGGVTTAGLESETLLQPLVPAGPDVPDRSIQNVRFKIMKIKKNILRIKQVMVTKCSIKKNQYFLLLWTRKVGNLWISQKVYFNLHNWVNY